MARVKRPFGLAFSSLLFSVLAVGSLSASGAERLYPDDPFLLDRSLLSPTAIGTAPGQMQVTALGALISGKSSDKKYLGGQLGLEFMMNEFGGMRISSFQEICDKEGDGLSHKLSSFRIGPALHFNPFHAFDYGTFVEGGIATVDAIEGHTSDRAPDVAIGGFLSYHLNSAFFIRAELARAWSNLEIEQVTVQQQRTAGPLGFGLAF